MEIVIRHSKSSRGNLLPEEMNLAETCTGTPALLKVMGFGPDGTFQFETRNVEEALSRIGEKEMLWIQVIGPSNLGQIQEFGKRLNIHPLALNDIARSWGRSKMEDFGEQILVVGKTTLLDVPKDKLNVEQVEILAGTNYVVSFQETDYPLFAPEEKRLLEPQRAIRRRGPGYLLYTMLDTLVDHLLASLDTIEEWITEMEDEVLVHKRRLELEEIYKLKRVVLVLARIATPMQELAKRLQSLDGEIVPDVLDLYFRDLAEHATRAVERIANARLVLQNLQEYFHMEGDHRNNDVMRVLTVVATIFIPLSFVAGVYGMNFNPGASDWSMPELATPYGYPITLVGMCVYALILMVYFKRKDWL